MDRYKHILLTTDFSEGSNTVNEKAHTLVNMMEAKMSILHVVEPLPGYGYGFVGLADIEMQLIEESKKRLLELGKKYNVLETNLYTEVGSTKTTITKKAEELGVDLIITGSHDRHGLDYLLGSTANAVIHGAKCDILTVRIKT